MQGCGWTGTVVSALFGVDDGLGVVSMDLWESVSWGCEWEGMDVDA